MNQPQPGEVAVLDYGFDGVGGPRRYLPENAVLVEDYDADFATRMKGQGLWAELIRQRFLKACARLGFNRERFSFDTTAFRPPSAVGQQALF